MSYASGSASRGPVVQPLAGGVLGGGARDRAVRRLVQNTVCARAPSSEGSFCLQDRCPLIQFVGILFQSSTIGLKRQPTSEPPCPPR